jgi:hypothetical protein
VLHAPPNSSWFYIAYHLVITEPALIVIISGKFVAKRVSSVSGAEAKSWLPQI